jgi:sugar phosphate isomerase/epimerase
MPQLSAFADEIAAELEEQIRVLGECGIRFLDLRGAWGKNVMELSDQELERVSTLLEEAGIGVAAVGSPIGKSTIDQPPSVELGRLERAACIAERLGARYIRVFSFYAPEGRSITEFHDQVFERIEGWLEEISAHHSSLVLVHENESRIWGETPERCLELLERFHGPNFVGCYDFANFVHDGIQRPHKTAWPMLKRYIDFFHLKDWSASTGHAVPCGEGDGEVERILAEVAKTRFDGFMTMEPHLEHGGQFRGFSGPELFRTAVDAVRALASRVGLALR